MAYQDNATDDARRNRAAAGRCHLRLRGSAASGLGGAGIAYLPDFLARPYVADGRLVRLWPTAEGIETVIHAIYPSHRSLSAKVRVFIDALVASFDGLQR